MFSLTGITIVALVVVVIAAGVIIGIAASKK